MKKVMSIMLLCVFLLFGIVVAWKAFVLFEEKKLSAEFEHPILTVSATKATEETWHKTLTAVGSTRTVKGVDVTTELSGMIKKIYFSAGDNVKQGEVLVVLNTASDVAQLHELEAKEKLAGITYKRDKKQFAFGAISKEQLDTDQANLESSQASVAAQKATIDKKIIRAPFAGRLGISAVNLGEYINAGEKVVSLETLNPIYVDFYLPQNKLGMISVGQSVEVTSDRTNKIVFEGKITTVNPVVDSDIRNVEIEATLPNPKELLLPGMFTHVLLKTGDSSKKLTLPKMAITFNPYGALVYVLHKTDKKHEGKPVWRADQQFVITGDSRGNQISVDKGIKAGDMVVTSGQLKLKNHSLVSINNDLKPSDNPDPKIKEQ